MVAVFRCDERCGKLLSVEAEARAAVRCPACNRKVAIPAGLASLPRPRAGLGAGADGGGRGGPAP